MRAVFIRHLPTVWNVEGRLQGRQDIPVCPITDALYEEISENKQKLEAEQPFDLVLASTLRRTKETAGLYGFEPREEPLLDELDFGTFEGRTKLELLQSLGNAWIDNPRELMLGESIHGLEERIYRFFEKYGRFGSVLVFGHGAWIRAMLSIHRHGDARGMNRITVGNNEYIRLKR